MRVRELMNREVRAVREDDPVERLIDVLVREHLHGAPVIDADGNVVGIVTQQDIFFSGATRADDPSGARPPVVGDIMTAPAVTVTEDTEVRRLCETLHRLRIHRAPVVRDGRLVGIVSALDVCGALGRGESVLDD